MKNIDKLINELKEDSIELYHKNRTNKEKLKLVIDMISETRKLKDLLEGELQELDNLD